MIELPTAEKLRWDYFDASDDPIARRQCAIPDTVVVTMERLGFEYMGCAQAIMRSSGVELLHEVWKNGDETMTAEVTAHTGRVVLVTLFEDGTLIKTSERPPKIWDWIHQAPGMYYHRDDRLHWAYVPWPIDDVLARHRARVAEVKEAIVPATSMRVHFASRIRSNELLCTKAAAQIRVAAYVSVVVSGVIGIAWALRVLSTHGRSAFIPVLGGILTMIVGIPILHVMRWFVAPWLVRRFPGPPPRTAEALLEAASHVERGVVYRYDD